MFNQFKKQPNKEQKIEHNRRWKLIKETIYPIFLECKSIHDMKRRLESVELALKSEAQIKVAAFRKQLDGDLMKSWNVKALAGKGEDIEQKVIDSLAEEKIEVVDEILTNLPRILESFITEEMMNREPKSLVCKWPE